MARTVDRNEYYKEPQSFSVGRYTFTNCQLIGKGTYGTVYKAYDLEQRIHFAIKVIRLDSREGVPGTCLREVSILKEITHPNIVKIHDVLAVDTSKKIYLIFDHLDYDLKMLIEKLRPKPFPMPYIKSFLYQLLRALTVCHTKRVLHRDLKPQNILVAADGTVKLADFGLARTFTIPSRCYTHEIVTLWYRAPEILLRSRFYSTAVDIWSLACVFAELVTSAPLFRADSEISQLLQIFQILGTPTVEIWPGLVNCIDYNDSFPQWKECRLAEHVPGLDSDGLDLLAQMLLYPPEERITSKAALSHRFLADVPIHIEPVATLFNSNDE
uniref:cyclin-dependent kinase n=1 Tax=Elaeophora elaphi TaxID=1147741 RepID=A0A0R3RWA1_9BILA